MFDVQTYDDWKAAALADDAETGAADWKLSDESTDFDYRVIRRRYDELVQIRQSGNVAALTYYLKEGIHGNMGGMGAPKLYAQAKIGTKKLIADYNLELAAALKDLAATSDTELPKHEKLDLLRRSSLCYGHTALMLSGAGSLGPFHLGVVRTLFEEGLLPRIISGASAGSMVAAMVGTHSDLELRARFTDDILSSFFQWAVVDPYEESPTRPIDQYDVTALIEALVPDLTFLEAFEKTGRYVNISVAPREIQQRSRLLNAITSPNALIREAVLASCAIPGIFPAVTLMARDESTGEKKPYVPSRQWVDGSIADDLPAKRLARMYGVNHTISSQINPLILWALPRSDEPGDLFSQFMHIQQRAGREWLKAVYPWTMAMVRDRYPLNALTQSAFSVMTQEYTADITIMPKQRLYNPSMLLARLSPDDTMNLVREGQRSTWPKVERIRICTAVSRCLDELLLSMDGTIR